MLRPVITKTLTALLTFLILVSFSGTASAEIDLSVLRLELSDYPEVKIHLNVNDSNGAIINNLAKSNIKIAENNVPVSSFELVPVYSDGSSLSVIVAMDISGSMAGSAFNESKKAATRFISSLGHEDSVGVIAFDHNVKLVQPLSKDKNSAINAVNKLRIGGDTALYEAAYRSVEALLEAPGSRAVVLITDGMNDLRGHNKSGYRSLQDAKNLASKNGVPIYTVGLGRRIDSETLQDISNSTGGYFLHSPSLSTLPEVYHQITRKLINGYYVKYESPDAKLGRMYKLDIDLNYNHSDYSIQRYFIASTALNHFEIQNTPDSFTLGGLDTVQIILVAFCLLILIIVNVILAVLLKRKMRGVA